MRRVATLLHGSVEAHNAAQHTLHNNSCVCGKFSVCPWGLQLGVLRCTMMQRIPPRSVSHGGAARRPRFLCRWALAWRSHRLVGVALLLLLPAHVAAQTAITNANIGAAATAWLTDPTTATTTYGPIADWNTAAVTTMANLFYPGTSQPTFNADISKWNVASVSNMNRVRLASVCAASSFSHVLSLT